MDYEDTINKFGKGKKVDPNDKDSFFSKLFRFFNVFDIEALWHIITHPQHASEIFDMVDWGIIMAAVAYVIVPLDAVPDFIPALGLLDDAAVITFIFHKFGTLIEKYRKTFMTAG